MNRLGASVLHGLPILSVEQIMQKIDAVGQEELRALAGELFAPDRLSAAAIGPDRGGLRRGARAAADAERAAVAVAETAVGGAVQ